MWVNFTRSEFACKCGCGFDTVDADLLEALETMRLYFGTPIHITSGCRCPKHNTRVGGVLDSQHLLGRAADIVVDNIPPSEVAKYAKCMELLGGQRLSVGAYGNFTHIDTRSGAPVYWEG